MPPAREIFSALEFIPMPFASFFIPVFYGDEATQELNAFITSHRIVHIERRWIDQGTQSA
jgi:hypothetical protein